MGGCSRPVRGEGLRPHLHMRAHVPSSADQTDPQPVQPVPTLPASFPSGALATEYTVDYWLPFQHGAAGRPTAADFWFPSATIAVQMQRAALNLQHSACSVASPSATHPTRSGVGHRFGRLSNIVLRNAPLQRRPRQLPPVLPTRCIIHVVSSSWLFWCRECDDFIQSHTYFTYIN